MRIGLKRIMPLTFYPHHHHHHKHITNKPSKTRNKSSIEEYDEHAMTTHGNTIVPVPVSSTPIVIPPATTSPKPPSTQASDTSASTKTSDSSSGSSSPVTHEYDGRFENDSPICSVLPGPPGELILPLGRGTLRYLPDFLTSSEATHLLTSVQGSPAFKRTAIDFRPGLKFLQPRDTAFFGTKLYSYGGERRRPAGWDAAPPASTMAYKLAGKIEYALGLEAGYFNVVLINRYKSGVDFMEWHSDNEKNMGPEPTIASVSVGSEREFLVRPRKEGMNGKPVDVVRYKLKHGSLLVMMGKMQRFYQHAVPRRVGGEGGETVGDGVRLNFTFRRVVDEKDMSCYPTEG